MSEAGGVWELFARAQHLHFVRGDILVLTTHDRLQPEQVQRIRQVLDEVSEGVTILVVEPAIEIGSATEDEASRGFTGSREFSGVKIMGPSGSSGGGS